MIDAYLAQRRRARFGTGEVRFHICHNFFVTIRLARTIPRNTHRHDRKARSAVATRLAAPLTARPTLPSPGDTRVPLRKLIH